MRRSPERHNLARLRLVLNLAQKQMAEICGCSTDTIQSVELGRLALSESLARRISAATAVHLHWLLDNDLKAPIISTRGRPYTRSVFEVRQGTKQFDDNPFSRARAAEWAVRFYALIRAILSSALKENLGEVATWKIGKFLEQCRSEFGHDHRLVPAKAQFALRADDSVPLKYRQILLKHLQIAAGVKLFREYDRRYRASVKRLRKELEPILADEPVKTTECRRFRKTGRVRKTCARISEHKG
jgi:transcriptional regulator with XRE-family HTH domain